MPWVLGGRTCFFRLGVLCSPLFLSPPLRPVFGMKVPTATWGCGLSAFPRAFIFPGCLGGGDGRAKAPLSGEGSPAVSVCLHPSVVDDPKPSDDSILKKITIIKISWVSPCTPTSGFPGGLVVENWPANAWTGKIPHAQGN